MSRPTPTTRATDPGIVNIAEVLRVLDGRPGHHPCPRGHTLAINPSTNTFWCPACGIGGDAADALVMRGKASDRANALDRLARAEFRFVGPLVAPSTWTADRGDYRFRR